MIGQERGYSLKIRVEPLSLPKTPSRQKSAICLAKCMEPPISQDAGVVAV